MNERKREWREITIRYEDGSYDELSRRTLEEVKKVLPILEALNEAKSLKDQLARFLGDKE